MKHLKVYENFKSPEDWQVGDIVVAIETKYADESNWLHQDYRYEIAEIHKVSETLSLIKVREVGKPYDIEIKYKNYKDLSRYFSIADFITLEEWKLKQDTDKYNI